MFHRKLEVGLLQVKYILLFYLSGPFVGIITKNVEIAHVKTSKMHSKGNESLKVGLCFELKTKQPF